jgi:hypothetical protein
VKTGQPAAVAGEVECFLAFAGVVNNYQEPDGQGLHEAPADVQGAGDDALHRQISKKAEVLRFEDLPSGQWLNRLLQECAGHL